MTKTIDAMNQANKPVAWRSYNDEYGVGLWETKDDADLNCGNDSESEPLYLNAQTPMTVAEIIAITNVTQTSELGIDGHILPISFVRAIENHHGIGGKP